MAEPKFLPFHHELEEDFFDYFQSQLQVGPEIGSGMTGLPVLQLTQTSNAQAPSYLAAKRFSLLTPDGGIKNHKLFRRELNALQKISHPHLAKLVVSARCPTYLVICTEFYPNGTLDSKLPDITDELRDRYFIQLACAVRYLNEHIKLVHCDVKLPNIFMDANNNPVLGDFGLCCSIIRRSSNLGGTKGYKAPELMDNSIKEIDRRKIDSYSLGVVLWAMTFKKDPELNPDEDYLTVLNAHPEVPKPIRWSLELTLETDRQLRNSVKMLLYNLHRTDFYPELIDSL